MKNDITIDEELSQVFYKTLGGKIIEEGKLPSQISSPEEEKAAEYECRRFLLNYQFEKWENLVVI